MLDLAFTDLQSQNPPPVPWTAERYLAVLHPRDGRGVVGGLTLQGSHLRAFTLSRDTLPAAASTLTEQEAYVALNPYHGPRGGDRRLAGLNALWLDLDTYKIPALAELDREDVGDRILSAISGAGLPPPSLLIDSGRGYYAVWLLSGVVPAALPRWRAVMRALTRWAMPLGADAACVDPARVLRLPGSWHEGAGRRVTIVHGDGARHAFEPLADAVWRAAGRPGRQDFDATRSSRGRRDRLEGAGGQRLRGLPRRAFWAAIRRDLDTLLGRWGGAVPHGTRDLWLHLYCCALTWDETGADVRETILQRAATATPGLTPREVARMMGPTIRRGVAAVAGQPRGCDPRYDYASDRMCEMLSVDRQLALELGLHQLIPADLRADRNRQRRTERRRAAGVQPRSIWLAAHPISRVRPWEAEGISRATWYRRRSAERRARLRQAVQQLAGTVADLCVLRETGPVSPYKGVAIGEAGRDQAWGSKPGPTPSNSGTLPETREKTTAAVPAVRPAVGDTGISAVNGARRLSPPTRMEPKMPAESSLDLAVLAAAAARLSHTELGALTRVALAVAVGPVDRRALAWRAQVSPDLLDVLDAWLRAEPDTGRIAGLVVAAAAPRPAHGPRQGLLFDATSVVPTPASSTNPGSLRAITIAAGVRVLGRAGVGEGTARSFLGQQLKLFGFGALAEAIDAIEPKIADIAEPRAWIAAYLRNHGGSPKTVSGQRPGSSPSHQKTIEARVPPAQKTRPLATPEFLGISQGRVEHILEQNRLLMQMEEERFGRLRKRG